MNIRLPLIVSFALIAAMLGLSLWAWSMLPPGALMPVHFGIDGRPDRFAAKGIGLFAMPLVAIGITALLAVIPRIEPRRLNLAGSAKFYRAVWIGIVALLGATHGAAIAAALHAPVDAGAVVAGALAILFIVMGNYLGKTRSNFFAGVRTPWTLSSEYSWERTHRLCGKLFVITGAATLAALLVLPMKIALLILIGLTLANVAVSVAMSYVYWARDPDRQDGAPAPR